MPCGKDNAPLFKNTHTGRRTAVGGVLALPYFNKNERAIALLHDEVNLAAAASGRCEIAHQQSQACVLQVCQCHIFASVALFFGAGLGFIGYAVGHVND